jgi:hypothetical protein
VRGHSGLFCGPRGPARRMLPGAGWKLLPSLPDEGLSAGAVSCPGCPEQRTAQLALYRQAGPHLAKSSRNSPVIAPVLVTFIG